ncbi:MAG: aminoglycoside 6'-N-acetyltransferase [Sphingomonas sp.]
MEITLCTSADLDDWTQLRVALWPDYPAPELRAGAAAMLDEAGEGVALICRVNGQPAGFAEGSLRRDYVNGCETSPVAFLEGIYVVPAHRNKGVAEALVERVAEWGRAIGCVEFASDALLENEDSHAFHTAIGFVETERVVYFRRTL